MLKIKSIKIKNYRQYLDETLNFNDNKGVFLFVGKNGVGKSNFLNAICWCLYGDEPFKHSNENDGPKSILNVDTADSDSSNTDKEVLVRIEVQGDDTTYIFQRKSTNGSNSQLQVLVSDDGNYEEHDQPTIVANNFLPKEIRDFFLFDGESVQKIFRGDYAPRLRDNIWRVSNIKLLDSAISHLDKTIDSLNSEINKDLPKGQELQENLRLIKSDIKESEKKIREIEERIDANSTNLQDMENKLKEYTESRDLQEKRNQLDKRLASLNNKEKEIVGKLNDLLISDIASWLLKDQLANMKNKISSSTEAGEIPPSIRTQFINELLNSGKCICGTEVKKGSIEEKELMKLLEEITPFDKRSFLVDDKFQVESLIQLANELPGKFQELKKEKAENREEKSSIQQQLAEISEKLRSLDSQEIGDIESTIIKLRTAIKNDDNEIAIIKHGLEGLNEDKKSKEVDLLRVQKQNAELQESVRTLDFLNNSQKDLLRIREIIIEKTRNIVSTKTNENFMNLIWKKDQFSEVQFNDKYEVIIRRTSDSGLVNISDLSTGETKVLGLATIKALSHVTNFGGVPVFIDGPLEYLDPEVQDNFLEMLPNYMPDKQVFIFSINDSVMIKFGQQKLKSSHFYQLVPDGNSTRIREFGEI